MEIVSPFFKNKEFIPIKYTCQGDDINPSLIFRDIPGPAKSLALIMDDPDAVNGVWVHWVVFNIPITSTIEENSIPGLQGVNSFKRLDYSGPCPPSGTHRYYFKIYALDMMLDIKEGAAVKELEGVMKGHILDKGQLIGLYQMKR